MPPVSPLSSQPHENRWEAGTINTHTDGEHRRATVDRAWAVPLFASISCVAIIWLRFAHRGFWLDETGTFWVVKDGLAEAIDRAGFQGQTPAYYVVAWLARVVGGDNELALRIPSLAAATASVYLVYRIGKRTVSADAGISAGLIFGSFYIIGFSASDARPYAIGLLLLTGSTLALLRWLDGPDDRFGYVWAVLGSLMFYFAYTFALALPAHAYLIFRGRLRGGRLALPAGTLPILLVFLTLTLPAAAILRSLLRQDDLLFWGGGGPGASDLFREVVPPVTAIGLMSGVVLARTFSGSLRVRRPDGGPKILTFFVLGLLVPLAVTFAFGILVSGKFFQQRYFVSATPALALLLGYGINTLRPRRAQRCVAVTVTSVALLFALFDLDPPATTGRGDWRAAISAVNDLIEDPSTPVLVHTGFASDRYEERTARAELLLAPLSAYPMSGRPQVLPYNLGNRHNIAFMERVAVDQLDHTQRFVLIESFNIDAFRRWLEERYRRSFSSTTVYSAHFIRVSSFERLDPQASPASAAWRLAMADPPKGAR